MSDRGEDIYIVGRGYQRRAELLAPYLGAKILYLPNRWKSKWMRPLDYILDFVASFRYLKSSRPQHVTVQSPPPYLALAPIVLGVPFTLDLHNAAFQGRWARLPLVRSIARRAAVLIAHNVEARQLVQSAFPGSEVQVLRDPIEAIARPVGLSERSKSRVLFICSFGADEPIDVIFDLIKMRPDIEFVITAPIHRLSLVWQERFHELSNLELTGYLPVERYQELLLTSGAAIVLTTRAATQPSGACEALSSDTPLVISGTSLTEELFGNWARIADNDPIELSSALDDALMENKCFVEHRIRWMEEFESELQTIRTWLPRVRDRGQT